MKKTTGFHHRHLKTLYTLRLCFDIILYHVTWLKERERTLRVSSSRFLHEFINCEILYKLPPSCLFQLFLPWSAFSDRYFNIAWIVDTFLITLVNGCGPCAKDLFLPPTAEQVSQGPDPNLAECDAGWECEAQLCAQPCAAYGSPGVT